MAKQQVSLHYLNTTTTSSSAFSSTDDLAQPASDHQPILNWIFDRTKQKTIAEMKKAGLGEHSRWIFKSKMDSKVPGYLYLWLRHADYVQLKQLKQLTTVEERIVFLIRKVLYVGIEAVEVRFEGHMSFSTGGGGFGSPFDRFVKFQLLNGERFVAIYFGLNGKKNDKKNFLFETVLKYIKNHFGDECETLLNVHIPSMSTYASQIDSSQFMSVMVVLLIEALDCPIKTFHSGQKNNEAAAKYFEALKLADAAEFETFIVNKMENQDGKLDVKLVLSGYNKSEWKNFITKMIGCKIVKVAGQFYVQKSRRKQRQRERRFVG